MKVSFANKFILLVIFPIIFPIISSCSHRNIDTKKNQANTTQKNDYNHLRTPVPSYEVKKRIFKNFSFGYSHHCPDPDQEENWTLLQYIWKPDQNVRNLYFSCRNDLLKVDSIYQSGCSWGRYQIKSTRWAEDRYVCSPYNLNGQAEVLYISEDTIKVKFDLQGYLGNKDSLAQFTPLLDDTITFSHFR